MTSLPAILALSLAAPPIDRPTRPAVQVLAFVGAGLLAAGLAFEINGQVGADPRAQVLEWQSQAQSHIVGGIALMGAGACLITIAALLTPWRAPAVSIWVSPSGATAAFRVALP